ncbi:MAG: biotin transporter BioY [Lachnospiraceae bacterium]|nr:biotin transporter BioY [Lachnospiraceae bacterium]
MKDSKTRDLVYIALMAAILCVTMPISIPIGPVPISLGNLMIFLLLYVVGQKNATIASLIFVLLGAVGLPVFSGWQGGFGKLAGPTGGYIIGWIPCAFVAGYFIDHFAKKTWAAILGCELGNLVLYVLGTAWLAVSAHMGFGAALAVGVTPFVIEDFAKVVIAVVLGPVLRSALVKAGAISGKPKESRA